MPTPPLLQLTPEEMRRLGYRVVDLLVAHNEGLRDRPVSTVRSPEELASRLGEFTEAPVAADRVLEMVERDVLQSITHVDHPRFFAFVPGPGNFVGVLADALAAGHNVFAGHWLAGSGPGAVELQTVRWLCDACGYPPGSGGLFVSGGSMANLSALAAARHITLGGPDASAVAYCSAQTHSSLAKGLRVLGFRPDQIRTVATDDDLRLSMPALRDAVAADRAAGQRPFCVIANAGTTNTGAVDPLNNVADLCAAERMWMHVDGAYGAAAVIAPAGRRALAGMERADSITFDPHKWLFQPFEIGCVLVKDVRHLRSTFAVHPDDHGDYLEDVTRSVDEEVIFYEHGVQLTRAFRALKLWMTLRVFGTAAMRSAIEYGIGLAETAERLLRADVRYGVVTPAQLGVVTFVPAGTPAGEAGDEFIRRIVERVIADGYAMLTSTTVYDRVVLRMCIINPATTLEDVSGTLARVAELADEVRRQ